MSGEDRGRFQILAKLGEGGMGVVYRAYDRVRDMTVALKTLRHVSATSLYRLKREFRALRDLSHPNIITFYELVSEDDEWCVSMELVDGPDFLSYVTDTQRLDDIPSTPLTHTDETPDDAVLTSIDGLEPGDPRVSGDSDGPDPPDVPPAFDAVVRIDRLRESLRQLARALHVLHSADMVHRDLKPSNVRITDNGRVVLMDFGVVAELRQPVDPGMDGHVIGTPGYMAPEQMLGAAPTAAADWYAFGVMIYQALTGRLPYEGKRESIMHAKQHRDPLAPSRFTDGIPAELERLCMRLLNRDPERRPSGVDVLAEFGVRPTDSRTPGGMMTGDGSTPFVGRTRELAILYSAFASVRNGGARCVFIQGPSGIGKSSLVAHFIARMRGINRDAVKPLVLCGRCHERESLSYKAFDSIVDDLSRHLLGISEERREAILPADLTPIATLFPTLNRVPQRGPRRAFIADGPRQLRAEAVAELRRILASLAGERPLVLWIEDIQWADRDSLDLLVSLLEPPAPGGIMVLATWQTDAMTDERGRRIQGLKRALDADICQALTVGPLSDDEQRLLVAELASEPGLVGLLDDALWNELGGHPMLAAELARYLTEAPDELAGSAGLRLEVVIQRRIERLGESARSMMEMIAVAGEPIPLQVLAEACTLSSMACQRAVTALRVGRLARIFHVERDALVDAYHHKVREAVFDGLSLEVRRTLHGRLAAALEHWPGASLASLAHHRLASGDRDRAVSYLIDEAQRASSQLAFGRAAELYRRALALLPDESGDRDIEIWRCRAWIGLAEEMRIIDDTDEAIELLIRAEIVANRHSLWEELASIHYLHGNMLFPRGDLDGCLEQHGKARYFAQRAGSRECEARALSGLGDAHYMRGHMISAYERYNACIALCRAHGLRGIESANLGMRGVTRYYHNDLDSALRDAMDATALAVEVGHRRAEVIARGGVLGLILIERGRLEEARSEFHESLDLSRALGAGRLEANALMFLSMILAIEDRRAEAEALIQDSIALCRRSGFRFVGPMALGVLALVTDDAGIRQGALDEAHEVLRRGAVSHNHLYFYRFAIDAALRVGNGDAVERYASALDEYTRTEPLPWSRFFTARGRALAAYLQGRRDHDLRVELQRLHTQATEVGLHVAARAIARALDER